MKILLDIIEDFLYYADSFGKKKSLTPVPIQPKELNDIERARLKRQARRQHGG